MTKFQITSLSKDLRKAFEGREDGAIDFTVTFTIPENGQETFGTLGEFYRISAIRDLEAYNKFYDEREPRSLDNMFAPCEDKPGYFKLTGPSPYDEGLIEFCWASGSHVIDKTDTEGEYRYHGFLVNCPIVQACYSQLETMRSDMEQGKPPPWGDYPEQSGCFRSADAFHDFLTILQCLDNLWD